MIQSACVDGAAPDGTAVRAEKVSRAYGEGSSSVVALSDIDLVIREGEQVAIMGPSGSGKSTLLNLIAGLDKPTAGRVVIGGKDLSSCSRAETTRLRREYIGYIPQDPSLLPGLTVEENVGLPLLIRQVGLGERQNRAAELLELVGLTGKARALPEELSGGQQQRASVARALASSPALLLADEPAGNLDLATAQAIIRLITEMATAQGTSLALVTHERDEATHLGRVVRLRDGRLAGEEM